MYNYEIIIENDKLKSNDIKLVLKVLKYFIDKDYKMLFVNNKTNGNISITDYFDIAMIEDNIEM